MRMTLFELQKKEKTGEMEQRTIKDGHDCAPSFKKSLKLTAKNRNSKNKTIALFLKSYKIDMDKTIRKERHT